MLPLRQAGRDVAAGLVVTCVALAFYASCAALIFQGPLQAHLPAGLGMALWGGALMALWTARTATLPLASTGPEPATVPVLAAMTAAVVQQAAPEHRFATAAATLCISALVLGACWVLMGHLRLGSLVRLVPYPVIGGFLAAVGWLMFRGGVGVASGRPADIGLLADLALHGPHARQATAAGVAIFLLWSTARLPQALAFPALLAGCIAAVMAGLGLAGIAAEQARATGWLMERYAELRPPAWWDAALWSNVDWAVVAAQAGAMASLLIVGTAAMLLAHFSLEGVFDTEGDLDVDLRQHGWANMLTGAMGGLLGGVSVSRSLTNHQAGARGRFSSVVVGVACLLLVIFGAPLVAWLPLPVLGGLSMFLGLRVLKAWLIDSAATMTRNDRAIVLGMVVLTMAFGYLPAVLAGVVICCFDFALSQARLGPVRRVLNARDWPTRIERSPADRAWLDRPGEELRIVELQGTLFFGSVQSLLLSLGRWRKGAEPETVLLDFRRVMGIDSSAVQALERLRAAARRAGVAVVCSGLNPRLRDALARQGGLAAAPDGVYRDISDAVVAWEDRRLALRTEAPPVTVQAWLAREIGDADMARQLSASLQRVDLAAGEPLFAEGDPADSLYFIASGRLTVTVRTPAGPLEIKVLQAGATAGEMGVYRASTRAATVQATQASQAWRLSRAQLNALEAQSPAMAIALHRLFVRLLADRLDHANAHARALAD